MAKESGSVDTLREPEVLFLHLSNVAKGIASFFFFGAASNGRCGWLCQTYPVTLGYVHLHMPSFAYSCNIFSRESLQLSATFVSKHYGTAGALDPGGDYCLCQYRLL